MFRWEKEVGNLPIEIGFKRLSDDATIPTRAHTTDSGFDLCASKDVIIEPGETVVVPTGISVQLPDGYEAQVRPRSGVTSKTKLRVQLGTIDNGYSGEIGVIVDNTTKDTYLQNAHIFHKFGPVIHDIEGKNVSTHGFDCVNGMYYQIRKGDRIAQLVVQTLPSVKAVEVFDVEETDRGEGGFGSTGVREEHGKCSYCRNEIAGTDKTADNVICKTCGDIMTRAHNQ